MKKRKRLAVVVSLLGVIALTAVPSAASAVPATVSPLPGTLSAMPQTQISFLGAAASSLSRITVVGSSSGRHAGRLRSYASIRGASFLPGKPFTPGERVTVRAAWRTPHGRRLALGTSFTVAQPATIPFNEFPSVAGKPSDVQGFHSRPDLRPAVVTVRQPAGAGSAPGLIFAAPFLGPGQPGTMIFDNGGNLVWFRPLPGGSDAADFRTQQYRGKTVLTWWQGKTVSFGYGLGEGVIANANYKTVSVVKTGNGLPTDEHEFLVTPHGSAWVLAYSPIQTSLASVGSPAQIALDGVIQQIDIHTGLVMWEWHSFDHVGLSESYSKPPASPTGVFDYFHINSLEVERHGNLLISARNTWGLYDINIRTGAVIWRLGGKQSTFTLGPGVQFAYQHDARWMPNGDISLFDDEAGPPVKPPSRGEIVKLDLKAKTATLVQQFVRTAGPLTTFSQGNSQSLPGGGWMVGWGGLPNMTEFNAQGQIVYDAQFPTGENSYRTYRLPWAGQPSERPSIVATPSPAPTPGPAATAAPPHIDVYASWNGATTVASWQFLSGSSSSHLKPVATKAKTGFETTVAAPVAKFFQARALSPAGKVLATSRVVRPTG